MASVALHSLASLETLPPDDPASLVIGRDIAVKRVAHHAERARSELAALFFLPVKPVRAKFGPVFSTASALVESRRLFPTSIAPP